jgi:hypothetical protein
MKILDNLLDKAIRRIVFFSPLSVQVRNEFNEHGS